MSEPAAVAQVQGAGDEAVADGSAAAVRVLRHVSGDGIEVLFQPIVDLATVADGKPRPVGFEALARLDGECPLQVLADAAGAGLSVALELRLISVALEVLTRLPEGTYLSVNASPATLLSAGFADLLRDVDPGRVVVELTEHSIVGDVARFNGTLARLRASGLRLAVDDVGTGYASLGPLLELRPDIIKLDASVGGTVAADAARRAVVGAFAFIAREIGAVLIVEGVEDAGEVPVLLSLDVEYGQGFALGRPSGRIDPAPPPAVDPPSPHHPAVADRSPRRGGRPLPAASLAPTYQLIRLLAATGVAVAFVALAAGWRWGGGLLGAAAAMIVAGVLVARTRALMRRAAAGGEHLEDVEHRLRTIVGSAPLVVFILEPGGTFSMIEGSGPGAGVDEVRRFLGRSAFRAAGNHPETSRAIERALAGHEFSTFLELAGRHFHTHFAPERDRSGTIARVVGVAVDVTDLFRAREERRALDTRYRSLFEYAPIAIWEEDFSAAAQKLEELRRAGAGDLRARLGETPDLLSELIDQVVVRDVNRAALRMLGVADAGDLIGRSPGARGDDAREAFLRQFEAIWDGQATTEMEFSGSNAAGEPFECVLYWGVPQRDGAGDLSRVIVAMEDVTARNRAAAEARHHLQVQAVLAELAAGFIGRRADEVDAAIEEALARLGEVVGADRAYVMLYSEDGATFSNTHEWTANGVAAMRQRIQELPVSALPWFNARIREGAVVVADVSLLPDEAAAERAEFEAQEITSLMCVPMVGADRQVGFVGFDAVRGSGRWSAPDVHVLTVAADMLLHALRRRDYEQGLRDLVRFKDTFISSVSHELRTPLTAVLGFAAEMRDAGDALTPEQANEYVTIIAEQSQETVDLVHDLLVAGRADWGCLDVVPESTDVGEVVASLGAALEGADRVRFLVEPGLTAWADPLRLRQVIRNLLVNAVRHGGMSIRLAARSNGNGTLRLVVADDGRGVPTHIETAIFEPYAHGPRRPGQPPSIGLGLSVARTLMRAMGGDVEYRRCDGWTEFVAIVPESPGSIPPPAG